MLFNMPIPVATIGLLIGSNLFMTYAWYGHLRHQAMPVLAAIVISWGVAFFEYCLQVPANRIGYGYFSAAELKTIQESSGGVRPHRGRGLFRVQGVKGRRFRSGRGETWSAFAALWKNRKPAAGTILKWAFPSPSLRPKALSWKKSPVARRHPEYFASLSPPASRVDHMGRMNSIL